MRDETTAATTGDASRLPEVCRDCGETRPAHATGSGVAPKCPGFRLHPQSAVPDKENDVRVTTLTIVTWPDGREAVWARALNAEEIARIRAGEDGAVWPGRLVS